MLKALFLYLILCLPVQAFQNKIDIMPGYSLSFYDDVGLSTIDRIIGPLYLINYEYDTGNRINLVNEFTVMQPNVFGESGTFDDHYFFLSAGLGFKYYPRIRGISDFRQLGDTAVLITSEYSLNPFVGASANFEVFLENSYKRSKLMDKYPDNPAVFMHGNRFFAGGNLVTGTDLVMGHSWGFSFMLRYLTLRSLFKVNRSNLLIMGISLQAGIYYNF